MAVTWKDVAAIVEARAGRRAWRYGSTRAWYVPSPTGGTFSVEVTLNPRWCTIAVDRWRTTDRDEAQSQPWFEEHIWPCVSEALKKKDGWGTLPSGHTISSAKPVERSLVADLLANWIDKELSWGVHADSQWPEFAPHRVTPGPEGNYGR